MVLSAVHGVASAMSANSDIRVKENESQIKLQSLLRPLVSVFSAKQTILDPPPKKSVQYIKLFHLSF